MIVLFSVYFFIALLQVPGLIREKCWRELAAFSFFYVAAFVLGLMFVLDITIPSPMYGIKYIVGDVLGLKYPEL